MSTETTPWDVESKAEPVKPIPPHEVCDRCKGTGGVPVRPALLSSELEYDECPDCIGTGRRGEARARQELAEERYEEWWA